MRRVFSLVTAAAVTGCAGSSGLRTQGNFQIDATPLEPSDEPQPARQVEKANALPEAAPTDDSCPDKVYPKGQSVTYATWLPGTIVGKEHGSRVAVRPAPNTNTSDGSYGLVGDSVNVVGEHATAECIVWYEVNFPESGWTGWVRGDHVEVEF
jgi:hypothetical protein